MKRKEEEIFQKNLILIRLYIIEPKYMSPICVTQMLLEMIRTQYNNVSKVTFIKINYLASYTQKQIV